MRPRWHLRKRLRRYAVRRAFLVLVTLTSIAAPVRVADAATTTQEVPVCKQAPHGRVTCFAIRLDRYSAGRVRHASTPAGYTPTDLAAAYSLPSDTDGDGMTVAIVDAYDDPAAEADL